MANLVVYLEVIFHFPRKLYIANVNNLMRNIVYFIFEHVCLILDAKILRGDTCNCDATVMFEHKSDFPDYETCRKKCIDTEGCYYFGLWEENASVGKGLCRLWKTCGSCDKALYSNKVYQLSTGTQINFVVWYVSK